MKIGIGVPNTIPGVTGAALLAWGRRAEERGFSSLATIGRVAYPGYEELITFAGIGAVTERIGFLTNVLLGPTRSAAELAKQAASVDQLTGGRLTLGLGVGARPDDFAVTGHDFADRGRRFDEQLALLRKAWSGEPLPGSDKPVGPAPVRPGGIPILIGGTSDAALRRVAEHGAGWTAGGAAPEAVAPIVERVRVKWREAGREGSPLLYALAYCSLGATEDRSRAYLLDYYGQFGAVAEAIADSALRTPEVLHEVAGRYADIGLSELILVPTVGDVAQVDLLADVVL